MTILEGRKLGFRFLVLDPDPDAPASRIADRWFSPEKVEEFYRESDVITWEFEHIEERIIEKCLSKLATPPRAIEIKGRRSREKAFLSGLGIRMPEFTVCRGSDLPDVVRSFGIPAVIKRDRLGYDGKGQFVVKSEEDLNSVAGEVDKRETYVVEKFIDFKKEISILLVRNREGEVRTYPLTENLHRKGILIKNWVTDSEDYKNTAFGIARKIADSLSINGLLAVEFFLTPEGDLLVNEIAPRPHNTGHYTLDGARTSQFENLVRSLGDLPLGETDPVGFGGMVNILGIPYESLPLAELLSLGGTKIYWYGKEPRPRRKLGHVNVVCDDRDTLMDTLSRVESLLYSASGVVG